MKAEKITARCLKECLIDSLSGTWRLPDLGDKFYPVRSREIAAEVQQTLGDLKPKAPSPYDLDQIHLEVRKKWETEHQLVGLARRTLQLLPWVLFYPKGKPSTWLGRDQALIEQYSSWVSNRGRGRSVAALLRVFLDSYPTEIETFDHLRRLLEKLVLVTEQATLSRWKERCNNFRVLDQNGTSRLLGAWVDSEEPVEDFLQSSGFSPGLEASGFLHKATEYWIRYLGEQLSGDRISAEKLSRSLTWLEENGRLRYEPLRVFATEALLSPFLTVKPSQTIEKVLREFFLRCLGDPRISRRAGWAGVSEPILHVLYRWLVGLALEDFFRLLDETAYDEHWRYRKKFWQAYLKENLITDAWVVLGPRAGYIARRKLEGGDIGSGKLWGVEGTQSVLIMKIHSIIIAEWSHNGSCRFWLQDNRRAPKIYQRTYNRPDLVQGADFSLRHVSSNSGKWQGQLAKEIQKHTGIRMRYIDYM